MPWARLAHAQSGRSMPQQAAAMHHAHDKAWRPEQRSIKRCVQATCALGQSRPQDFGRPCSTHPPLNVFGRVTVDECNLEGCLGQLVLRRDLGFGVVHADR